MISSSEICSRKNLYLLVPLLYRLSSKYFKHYAKEILEHSSAASSTLIVSASITNAAYTCTDIFFLTMFFFYCNVILL